MTRRWFVVALGGWLLMAMCGGAIAEPKRVVCPVCRVTKGEAEEEEIRAVRTHAGKVYGFCSDKCAEAFDADPAAYIPPVFPRPAPAFALADLGGAAVSNASLAGKVVLVDFWATWCAPCRAAMPGLDALHRKYSGRGFSVIGISIDENGAAKVKKFVAAKKISYPIALDTTQSPAWEAFGVKAVPAAYLIDREGRVVAQWTGAPPNESDLITRLEDLLGRD